MTPVARASVLLLLQLVLTACAQRGPTPEAREAVQALTDMRSALSVGVTLQDYGRRLADAKIKVDRFLSQPERGDKELRMAVAHAIEHYRLAGKAWALTIPMNAGYGGDEAEELGRESGLVSCGYIAQYLDLQITGSRVPAGTVRSRGYMAAREFKQLWRCAADKTADAERLLK
jgi:hypothetical protein